LFWEGEKVEKVDGAIGVVGGHDARGFSGLGLADRDRLRSEGPHFVGTPHILREEFARQSIDPSVGAFFL